MPFFRGLSKHQIERAIQPAGKGLLRFKWLIGKRASPSVAPRQLPRRGRQYTFVELLRIPQNPSPQLSQGIKRLSLVGCPLGTAICWLQAKIFDFWLVRVASSQFDKIECTRGFAPRALPQFLIFNF